MPIRYTPEEENERRAEIDAARATAPSERAPSEIAGPVGSLGLATGSASGPRLRCDERSANHFYGRYKGHIVQVERDHPSRAFAFLVVCPDGTRAADGIADKGMTMREVIIHALTGALLWPNAEMTDANRTEK